MDVEGLIESLRALAVIPKAGDTIEALLARVKELEEALTEARSHLDGSSEDNPDLDVMIDRALVILDAALNPSPTEQGDQSECEHSWRYVGTDPKGSRKGEDRYVCTKCGEREFQP